MTAATGGPAPEGVAVRAGAEAGAGPGHVQAIALAALVTFLWSTSWVLIKFGLQDLDLAPLSFAGLRYALAAAVLLPLAWPGLVRAAPRSDGRGWLLRAAVLGVLLYAVAQGAQFAALDRLPAATVGLILASTPVVVALLSLRDADEGATRIQAVGVAVLAAGVVLYFGVAPVAASAVPALGIAAVGMVATALGARLGRELARDAIDAFGGALGLTAVTMGIGASVLLTAGVLLEGVPRLDAGAWMVLGWLALVNTAFAFTVWNHTMRRLTAVESSVLNDLMLIQIALLAWFFLDETLDAPRIAGLLLALGGVLLVQLGPILKAYRGRAAGRG